MKVSLVGISGVPLGKHKVKDPRLDQVDKLVEADKKTYALVDVVGEEEALTSDAIAASPEGRLDLIIRDLELVETRLGRNPPDAEKAVLQKIQGCLEAEQARLQGRAERGGIADGRGARLLHDALRPRGRCA